MSVFFYQRSFCFSSCSLSLQNLLVVLNMGRRPTNKKQKAKKKKTDSSVSPPPPPSTLLPVVPDFGGQKKKTKKKRKERDEEEEEEEEFAPAVKTTTTTVLPSTKNRKQRRAEAKLATEKGEKDEGIKEDDESQQQQKEEEEEKKKEDEKELTPPREVDVEHEGENTTVREILRLPRYFDDDFEAAAMRCFRCGKGGHREFECTLPAKQKPCHLCGDFDHQARDCPKGLCFNCLTPGHRSRDCEERRGIGRDQQSLCCLRCGRSGHVVEKCMFTFSEADLKRMPCYVCGEFGSRCRISRSVLTSRSTNTHQRRPGIRHHRSHIRKIDVDQTR